MNALLQGLGFILNSLGWVIWLFIGLVLAGVAFVIIAMFIGLIWNFFDWIKENYF